MFVENAFIIFTNTSNPFQCFLSLQYPCDNPYFVAIKLKDVFESIPVINHVLISLRLMQNPIGPSFASVSASSLESDPGIVK